MTRFPSPNRIPVSTYRLQFNYRFTFRDAAELVGYLERLGITDVYASPILAARPGSIHGYDVIDHSRLNPELGTRSDFELFSDRLRNADMGLIADVVTNHMSIAGEFNAWWLDVLENGPSSPYAGYFDIEWHPPKDELTGKVLLPVLGSQFGRALENQDMRVFYVDGAFAVCVYQTRLPLYPRSWATILRSAAARLRAELGDSNPHVLELESIITSLDHLPLRSE